MPDPELPQSLDVAGEISQETRFRAKNILSGGDKNLENVRQEQVLAVLQEIAGAKGLKLNFTQKPDDQEEELEVNIEENEKDEKTPQLTPEEAEKTLNVLEARFNENTYLHEGINWSDVKTSLEANPETLWNLAQMEAAGHKPDVYHEDENYYFFGTCSKEIPESTRNCVYDKQGADYSLRKDYPEAGFNGSAVEMAEAMGIRLMTPEHYKYILQEKGRFDEDGFSWLLTHSDIRLTCRAFCGHRFINSVDIHKRFAHEFGGMGWRGSIKVKKVTA